MELSVDDLPTLFKLMSDALSQDENLRKTADATLSNSESRPGFCSCLLEIISAKDLPSQFDARWLASVYFKNSVNRFWRHRIISEKEKSYLREKLLDLIKEENLQVAIQIATIVSKIARIDYPKEWPELFSNLVGHVFSSDILISQRACMILHETLKELATKRLAVDQRNFSEITRQHFDPIWHLWCNDAQTILHEFYLAQSPEHKIFSVEWKEKLQLACDRWLLCLKVIRRMIAFGLPSDAKSVQVCPRIKDVCKIFMQAVQSLLQCRSGFEYAHHDFCVFAEKICVKLMKVLVAIQKTHPFSFSDPTVISPILDFCYRAITESERYIGSFEHFLIHSMMLMKSMLECPEYKLRYSSNIHDTITSIEKLKRSLIQQAESIIQQFMNNERIILLCRTLVHRYFILTSKDLEEWALDPESFYHEQQLVQWSEKIRPCAEALYLIMLEKYHQVITPFVIQILKEVTDTHPPIESGTTSAILLRDAVYTAIGLAQYELSNHLNFKAWFEGALLLELHTGNSSGHIIRRTVAWLLGQWVSEIKDDVKSAAYSALLNLLQDNDQAVKLAACRSFYIVIEDIHFSEDKFAEFIPAFFHICLESFEVLQELDSKIQMLNLVSLMIDHLGVKIVSFSDQLIKFFAKVWAESSGQSLLRIQIILSLRNYVDALGPWSPMCYNVLLPILQTSIDINNPDELNLLENGMLLWETTLCHAPSMISQLLQLFVYLVAVIRRSFDHVSVAMKIIEEYIILGGEGFLNVHGSDVASVLDAVVGNANHKGMMCTFPVIEILLQCCPGASPHLLSLVFQKLIVIFLNGGDEIDPAKEAIRGTTGAIFARLVVQNSNYFVFFITQPSLSMAVQQSGITSNQNIIFQMVDAWVDKVDSVAFTCRKVYGLALSLLLTLRGTHIVEKLEQILSVCSSILASDIEDEGTDVNSENHDNDMPQALQQSKDFKRQQVEAADPVKKISLANMLRESLQTCATLHGEAFNAAMCNLHPALTDQLQLFLQSQLKQNETKNILHHL